MVRRLVPMARLPVSRALMGQPRVHMVQPLVSRVDMDQLLVSRVLAGQPLVSRVHMARLLVSRVPIGQLRVSRPGMGRRRASRVRMDSGQVFPRLAGSAGRRRVATGRPLVRAVCRRVGSRLPWLAGRLPDRVALLVALAGRPLDPVALVALVARRVTGSVHPRELAPLVDRRQEGRAGSARQLAPLVVRKLEGLVDSAGRRVPVDRRLEGTGHLSAGRESSVPPRRVDSVERRPAGSAGRLAPVPGRPVHPVVWAVSRRRVRRMGLRRRSLGGRSGRLAILVVSRRVRLMGSRHRRVAGRPERLVTLVVNRQRVRRMGSCRRRVGDRSERPVTLVVSSR